MNLKKLFSENWVLFIILFYVVFVGGFVVALTLFDFLLR